MVMQCGDMGRVDWKCVHHMFKNSDIDLPFEFEYAKWLLGCSTEISKTVVNFGSSQHGNTACGPFTPECIATIRLIV